ncbi:Inner membrane transport protein YbaT [Planctomycetes bacterium Pla163]|uniref:Inner membrane transport protein YbaT n=1 Tax=Rohdeia mirabilis TaxID=2528008 RepID=A0A518CUM4_9BACT|nr:Inner membrane transport protein YbaT [Planctomycetes bacterium Pla163]
MMSDEHDADSEKAFKKDSLSLLGAVAMGTGVMIGAGIFAITGQVAEQAGRLFPLAFVAAAIISSFSAYTYVKMSNASPSSGGIASYLQEVYGKGTATASFAVLMYLSMVINESLVARTFGTYTLQLFDVENTELLIPALGVGLLAAAFLVNIAGNELIGKLSVLTAFVKIAGIAAFAVAGLWASGISLESGSQGAAGDFGVGGMLTGTALGILAYKGFTTITNSGAEIKEPKKNVGRAIIISIAICACIYLAVSWAVGSSLTIDEIVAARDFALAEAARPAFGELGRTLTIALAILATISGVIASVFGVSRMLTMLTKMKLVPHRHFGMPGDVHTHTIVYTVVAAMLLTVFFDLGRIASIGAIFYLLMDMALHWGVLRNNARDIGAKPWVLVTALVLDGVVLAALVWTKGSQDPMVLYAAGAGLLFVFGGERIFLHWNDSGEEQPSQP